MNELLQREAGVHGQHWQTVHGGYFSDPAIAAPIVQKALELARRSHARRIVDLGGGTGFLLSQLQRSGLDPRLPLVVVDESEAQTEIARASGFLCVQKGIEKFLRQELGDNGPCLWMMRSVLHYFGEDGLRPALRHLRRQILPGEFFIHQTASFEHPQDADCLNTLYRLMGSPKWYPTVTTLRQILEEEGWEVLEVLPAPPLPLTSGDLSERYHIAPEIIRHIHDRLGGQEPTRAEVFEKTPDGFCAYLHYSLYVCRAKHPASQG